MINYMERTQKTQGAKTATEKSHDEEWEQWQADPRERMNFLLFEIQSAVDELATTISKL